jgi:hypothetical protein
VRRRHDSPRRAGQRPRGWLTRPPRGSFTRQLSLGEGVDSQNLTAGYADGVLHVTIPALPKTQARRVETTCGSGGSRAISASPAAPEAEALDRFAEFSGKWEKRYPAIIRLRENIWAAFVPFLRFRPGKGTVICTTTRSSQATRGCGAR